MAKFKKFPRNINPKAYDELASTGFKSALRLLAFKRDIDPREALVFLSDALGRDVIQMENYKKFGLPDHLVGKVLEILEANDVPCGSHQLRPNSSMVNQADLDAKNTSANGQTRIK